jgi:hypothetical protein
MSVRALAIALALAACSEAPAPGDDPRDAARVALGANGRGPAPPPGDSGHTWHHPQLGYRAEMTANAAGK